MKGLLTAEWPDPVLCETRGGGFEQVFLKKGTCSCLGFADRGTCEHLTAVRKWLAERFDHYLAISSFHKEIRRSDFDRSLSWAKILVRHQSPKSLIGYLERICLEETRNIPLFIRLRKKELSLQEALTAMISSRKKWELGYLLKPSHFDLWADGFRRSFLRPPPLPIEIGQIVRTLRTPSDVYCLFFDLRRDKTLQPHFWEALEEIAVHRRHERLKVYLKHASNTSYARMIGGELLIDLYQTQAREHHPIEGAGKVFVPYTRPYHFDSHHSRGRSILIENFGRAWREKCFQFDGLDLRVSGSLLGCLFRERCLAEKGSLKRFDGRDWDWQDVAISDNDYVRAVAIDQHYYSALYGKIIRRHPDLDCFKLDDGPGTHHEHERT